MNYIIDKFIYLIKYINYICLFYFLFSFILGLKEKISLLGRSEQKKICICLIKNDHIFIIRNWLMQLWRLRIPRSSVGGDPELTGQFETKGPRTKIAKRVSVIQVRKKHVPDQGSQAGGVPCYLLKSQLLFYLSNIFD